MNMAEIKNRKIMICLLLMILAALISIVILLIRLNFFSASSSMASPDGINKGQNSYDKQEVRNTITKYNAEIKECYIKFIATNPPKTDGKVMMDWQIDPTGEVIKSGVVTSDINNPFLEDCITSSIKNWEF